MDGTANVEFERVTESRTAGVGLSNLSVGAGVSDVQAEKSRQMTTDTKICNLVVLIIKVRLLHWNIHRSVINVPEANLAGQRTTQTL